MTIDTVINIAALKAYTDPLIPGGPPPPLTVIYVDGYYNPGDGGGGEFLFDASSTITEDHGINFSSDAIRDGRWVRQYYGHINAMYFGITKYPDYQPLGPYSNSDRIQMAINYGDSTGGIPQGNTAAGDLTVYFPAGSYWLDKTIILKEQTHLKGDDGTILNMQIENDYMFKIDKGPLTRVCVENFIMDLGAERKDQPPMTTGGFLIEAIVTDPVKEDSVGGLWSGIFRDIKMINMAGHGIYLCGGDSKDHIGRKTNQYIYFDNIWIERRRAPANCVKMTGAQVNLSFENCQFAIPYETKVQPPDLGANISIQSIAQSPIPDMNAQIAFINCATGGGPGKSSFYAAEIINADNITFENCWFEDTEIAISIEGSRAINILNSRFANAGGQGTHEGDCIRILNSKVNIEHNYTLVSYPDIKHVKDFYFIRGLGEDNVINSNNNSFSHILLSRTFGITQYTNVKLIPTYYDSPSTPATVYGIDTGEKKLVLIMPSGKEEDHIYRINSSLNAAEVLFIRAEVRALTIHAWDPVNELQGRNIYLGGLDEVNLLHGQMATFVKTDGVNQQEYCSYQLSSIF